MSDLSEASRSVQPVLQEEQTAWSNIQLEDRYLEGLAGFLRTLREQGLPVGTAEALDATRTVELLGTEDRAGLKSALCAVLAKSAREQAAFSAAFDRYFVPPRDRAHREEERRQADAEAERKRREAEEELRFAGEPIEIRRDLMETYTRLPDEAKEKLQRYMETFSESFKRSPSLYHHFMRNIIEQQLMLEDAGTGVQNGAEQDDLLTKNIADIRDAEIPRAVELIRKLALQMGGELSSRRRRAGQSGKLDFRKTIRLGLQNGGAFVRLSFRRRHRRRKRILLLCDVSASMARYSGFAIRLIKSLSDASDRSDIFLFSEELQRVDAFSLANMDTFERDVKSSALWGKGTDVGKALDGLMHLHPPVLHSSVVLLIVSDAKTIDLPRAEAALQKAGDAAAKVFWINPIPTAGWKNSKSISALADRCRMASCSTLEELAKTCMKLF